MSLSTLGLVVQTVGAGLLALIFLYLSRDNGNRVLRAAGIGWLMLFFALLSLIAGFELVRAFDERDRADLLLLPGLQDSLSRRSRGRRRPDGARVLAASADAHRPHRRSSRIGRPRSFRRPGLPLLRDPHGDRGDRLDLHLRAHHPEPRAGPGKAIRERARRDHVPRPGDSTSRSSGISALHHDEAYPFLQYTGFYDLFLEMLFGIGLIIWAMEDTERKLIDIHARAVDDTQRSKRRAQIDPLTEAHNRFFLDEIRPSLMREPAGGSIVLIDVDGLKEINDREGHEEGDKAIWTVAAGDEEADPRRRLPDPLGRRRVSRRSSREWTRRSPRSGSTCSRRRSKRFGSRPARRRAPTRSSWRRRSASRRSRPAFPSTWRSRWPTGTCTSARRRTSRCAAIPLRRGIARDPVSRERHSAPDVRQQDELKTSCQLSAFSFQLRGSDN